MYEALIWASVVVYFLVRVEAGYRAWLRSQDPLQKQHYDAFNVRLNDIQNQINGLAVRKDYD